MVLLRSDPKTLQQGSPAPDFSLENVDGKMVSLGDFKGRPVLIIFMCNHCPYVKPKMKEIASIQNEYEKKGLAVLCINSNDPDYVPEDSFENMKSVAKKFGFRCYLFDETQRVARSYGATCTPDPFLFDHSHRLFYHGRINDALNPDDAVKKRIMKDAIGTMLRGEKMVEWFLPSMGCSIKWKDNPE